MYNCYDRVQHFQFIVIGRWSKKKPESKCVRVSRSLEIRLEGTCIYYLGLLFSSTTDSHWYPCLFHPCYLSLSFEFHRVTFTIWSGLFIYSDFISCGMKSSSWNGKIFPQSVPEKWRFLSETVLVNFDVHASSKTLCGIPYSAYANDTSAEKPAVARENVIFILTHVLQFHTLWVVIFSL